MSALVVASLTQALSAVLIYALGGAGSAIMATLSLLASLLLAFLALSGSVASRGCTSGLLLLPPLWLAWTPEATESGVAPWALWAGFVAASALLARRFGRGSPPGSGYWVAGPLGAVLAVIMLWLRFRLGQEVAASWSWTLAPAAALALGLLVLLAGRFLAHRRPARRRDLALVAGLALSTIALLISRPDRLVVPPLLTYPTQGQGRPSILLLVLDTVRADHLEAYGYRRATMPGLTQFAGRHMIRVARALAVAPVSLESHASMLTGLVPPRHGAHLPSLGDASPPGEGLYPLADRQPTLAATLAAAGYWTVGLSGNCGPLSPRFGLGRGFHSYQAEPSDAFARRSHYLRLSPWLRLLDHAAPPGFEMEELRRSWLGLPCQESEEILRAAQAVLEESRGRPLFLFLNLFDAHVPFPPGGDEAEALLGRELRPESPLRGDGWLRLARQSAAGERVISPEDREEIAALYDLQLMRLDRALAAFLARLERQPGFSELVILVTSDHGESLGERGLLGHGSHLFDEQIRVPLFVKPSATAPAPPDLGQSPLALFSLVDVFPTLLEQAGLEPPPGIDGVAWGQGRSEARAWLYRPAHLVGLSQAFDRELRSIEHQGWKLIASTRREAWLFDLRRDPAEEHNLAAEEPARRQRLLAELAVEAIEHERP